MQNEISIDYLLQQDYSFPSDLMHYYLRDAFSLPRQTTPLRRTLNEVLSINSEYDKHVQLFSSIKETIQIGFTLGTGYKDNEEELAPDVTITENNHNVGIVDIPVISTAPTREIPDDLHCKTIIPLKYTKYPERPVVPYFLNSKILYTPTWYNVFYAKKSASSVLRQDGKTYVQANCFITKDDVIANGASNIENTTNGFTELSLYFGNLVNMESDITQNGKRLTYYDIIQTVPFYRVFFKPIMIDAIPEAGIEIIFNIDFGSDIYVSAR